ncbi:MAG TPA: glycogen-binding domain-containing protein [Thermodesulfobacteriota bacterium]|nr:glycogen-binding domain-containing protein [Thermodesulfobacteriota bacterium]
MRQKDPFWQTVDSKPAGSGDKTSKQERKQGQFLGNQMEQLTDKDLQIAHWVQKMPDLEPPSNLMASVMQSIQPKRLSWIQRVALWAKSPKSFTFTPVRLAPAAMVLIGILVISGYWVFRQKDLWFYPNQAESHIPVVFSLNIPEAHEVAVVGTFNGWKPNGYEMQFNPEKKIWSLTVRLPEGRYEYAFLVNGQRVVPDPEATLYQDDGFGNENSVMILRTKNEKAA